MAINRQYIRSLVLALVALVNTASGQMISGRPNTTSSGFVYTNWELKQSNGQQTSLGQFWLPVSGFVALQENFEARYYWAGSTNNFEANKAKSYLDGIGDFRIEVTRSVADNQFFVSGNVSFPTGKRELVYNKDRAIVELLSENYLNFPMRRFGEGLGFGGTVGFSQTWGKSAVGLGVSFDIIGKYKPYKNAGDYNPGEVMTVELGISTRGDKSALSTSINYLEYTTDQYNGKRIFRQGQQVGFAATALYDNNTYRINPTLRYTNRGRNTRYQTNTETIRDRIKLYGNEFEAGIEIGRHIRGNWLFSPLVSILLIQSNEVSFGDSKVLTLGGSISKKLTDKINLGSWFKAMTGDADDSRIDLKGYQVSASITAVI